MKKVCAQWVPHSLTTAQKQKHVETCQQLLQLYSTDPAEVDGVEACWEPSSQEVTTRTICLEANGETVFWDQEGTLLLDWLPHNTVIDSDWYCNSLCKLHRSIQQCHCGKWGSGVLLQHDNVRPHGSRHTIPTLFDAMKDAMQGKMFTSDQLQAVAQQWHWDTPKEWFAVQMQKRPEKKHLVSIIFERP
jgi:hypothetical protein